MKQLKGKTALITGASSGIGEAFAVELASQECNLIITARSKAKLLQKAEALRREFGVKVAVYSGDLSLKETPQKLFDKIREDGLSVDLLVNNAGVGKWTNFLDEPLESYGAMLQLNINALVKLTYLFLPEMLKNKEGGVINIASTGAFQPCPYVAAYCASKSFVLHFSEALYGEYHKMGITITAVCPGNTDTGFQKEANANTQGMASDSPEKVAKDGLRAFLQGSPLQVVGVSNYVSSLLPRFLPRKTVIGVVRNMMNKKVNP
ncbi:MAG: SDR family oxidoreductase [Spirosomataceae bacterium]